MWRGDGRRVVVGTVCWCVGVVRVFVAECLGGGRGGAAGGRGGRGWEGARVYPWGGGSQGGSWVDGRRVPSGRVQRAEFLD